MTFVITTALQKLRQMAERDYRHRGNKGVAYWVAPSQYIKVKEMAAV